MTSIHSSYASLRFLTQLNAIQNRTNQSIRELSSGTRLNVASDDPSRLAAARAMKVNVSTSDKLGPGIHDAINLMQVADTGLSHITDVLQRTYELATRAANTTLSSQDRAVIEQEYTQLAAEIDHISVSTEVFGQFPLAPAVNRPLATMGSTSNILLNAQNMIGTPQKSGTKSIGFIPEGTINFSMEINDNGLNDDIQVFTASGKHLAGTKLGTATWADINLTTSSDVENEIFTAENGFKTGTVFDDTDLNTGGTRTFAGMNISYSGDQHASGNQIETLSIDHLSEPIFIVVTGTGEFYVNKIDGTQGPSSAPPLTPLSKPLNFLLKAPYAGASEWARMSATPADVISLGLENVSLSSPSAARDAMDKIQAALNTVGTYRSEYGTLINRSEAVINEHAERSEHIEAARRVITDTDFAASTATLVKSQILQQVNLALFAQTTQGPASMLSLLGRVSASA